MTDDDRARPEETLQSQERRRFFEVAGKFGVTTAIVAVAAGTLVSSEAAGPRPPRRRRNVKRRPRRP